MKKNGSKFVNGFTLMELLVTVTIIGILASMAVPSYLVHIERVRASEGVNSLTALLASQVRYNLENSPNYAAALANLDITIAASNNFAVPQVFNSAAVLASIQRNGAAGYALTISSTGLVSCSCPVSCSPADICAKLGY
jgi:type IV pilus assembly protein PilE